MEHDERLVAHAEELASRAERGEITYTAFLTPREQIVLSRHFGVVGMKRVLAAGGYEEAERRRFYFLPPYFDELQEPYRTEALGEIFDESLAAVLIEASGYRALSHRDFLGSVLALGIERDRIGDVCVLTPARAVLFCGALQASFLSENLRRVANDAVRVSLFSLPPDFDGGRRYAPVSDTVASPRADAVVAALADLSRERAQALFREGRVEIDYEVEEKYDRTIDAGAVVVIRGVGKFRVRALDEKTKKGRLRLVADRYV